MGDNPKPFETTSAPSLSKQPPTRPLRQFTVPNTKPDGSEQPKSTTASHVETETDRPLNLLPTSHKTHAANPKPDPNNPRYSFRRSTEHNAAPFPFTCPVPSTSSRIVDTVGVVNDPQTFHRRPYIAHRQHQDSRSTIEYQPVSLGDRESLESLVDDETTFPHPRRPQIVEDLSVAAPVHRGRVAPSQNPATSDTPSSLPSTKDRRHNKLYDRSLAAHPSGPSQIIVKHEVDSRSSKPRNDASGMERAPVILRASDYHGATPPTHYSQDPLPFRTHSPIHPILIPGYEALGERYFRNLRQEEPLPTTKRVETVETNLIPNEPGAHESQPPPSLAQSRSLRWPGAERPQLPTLQRRNEVATLERNSSDYEPIQRTFQTSDIREIDSPVPNQLKSLPNENGPSNTALTTSNCSTRRRQIRVPRQDTAAPESLASTPPETNYVTREKAPSLRADPAERVSMSTDPSPSVPHTKKPAPSTSSSSSSEDRQPKKQPRTSATSSTHMDFYGSNSLDWDAQYLSSIPTSLLLNNQYQHSVTVSPHQLHTPQTHHHYHHYQHVSPFSLHHQPPSSIQYPFSPPPAPPIYPTSIPPHLTTLNHTHSSPPVPAPSIPFPEPPPTYAPTPTPAQYGGKEKPQFAPRFHLPGAENAPIAISGRGSGSGGSSRGVGDHKGKGKAADRGSSTASNSTTGKKRKRESSEIEDAVDTKQRQTRKQTGVDGEHEENEGETKDPPSPTDQKKSGRKRNNKIDIACNHCRARKLKCNGARPICANCVNKTKAQKDGKPEPVVCEFDPFPRRRGPAKHKQLKLDTESEASWPLLRVVPRTRARAAAEAKVVVQPLLVGAGAGASRSASTGGSEASSADGSGGGHPSATSFLFGGERINREAFGTAVTAAGWLAAPSTRESTPTDQAEAEADEEIDQIEEPQAPMKMRNEDEEQKQVEEVEKPRVEDEEHELKPKRKEVKLKKEQLLKKEKSAKKEEKKEAGLKMEGDEGKLNMVKKSPPEASPPSYHLSGHHITSYPSTSTHRGYVGGHVATTTSTRSSPSAAAAAAATPAAAGLFHAGPAPGHEEEQGVVSDEEAESSDDDYDSQGEESE